MSSAMEQLVEKAKSLAVQYMTEHPDAWTILKNRNRSIPFSREEDPVVLKLMNDIDVFSGYIHSGASLSIIMRYLESMC